RMVVEKSRMVVEKSRMVVAKSGDIVGKIRIIFGKIRVIVGKIRSIFENSGKTNDLVIRFLHFSCVISFVRVIPSTHREFRDRCASRDPVEGSCDSEAGEKQDPLFTGPATGGFSGFLSCIGSHDSPIPFGMTAIFLPFQPRGVFEAGI
ncbi:MAG: hypothetical protein V4710_12540, partial [Verrucomicrobiota bacterium]